MFRGAWYHPDLVKWRITMRLILACVVALALASLVASAGEIGVPDNNPATGAACNVGPFGYTEARHQALIPASMLGGKPILINEFSFASCQAASPTLVFTTLVVTFAHTTLANLNTTLAANLTKDVTVVLNGSVKWPTVYQKWSPMGLTGTFLYNGVDNLVVEVKFIGATGGRLGCYRSNNIERAYVTGAGTFNATTATTSMTALKMQFKYFGTQLTLSGSPKPGGTITLDLSAPGDPTLSYQLGSSFGLGPIVLGSRQLDLSPDALLTLSVGNFLPGVFARYSGTLDATGKAQAAINIPKNSARTGVRIHTAFVTLDAQSPFGVRSISGSKTTTISK